MRFDRNWAFWFILGIILGVVAYFWFLSIF